MKVLEKQITKTEIVGYEAEDGKIFENESECLKYEKTCRCVIMSEYRQLVIGVADEYSLFFGREDTQYEIVEIKNENDVLTINKMFAYFGMGSWYEDHKITNSEIGKTIFIYHDTYDDDYSGFWVDEETIIKRFRKVIEDAKKGCE